MKRQKRNAHWLRIGLLKSFVRWLRQALRARNERGDIGKSECQPATSRQTSPHGCDSRNARFDVNRSLGDVWATSGSLARSRAASLFREGPWRTRGLRSGSFDAKWD